MAIAFVQKVAVWGTCASVTTGAINTTAGNLLVAFLGDYGTGKNVTPSDNNSETWADAVAKFNSGYVSTLRESYVVNCGGRSGHTFTNTSNGGYPAIAVSEWSGVATTAPVDVVATLITSVSPPVSCPDVTTTVDGCLVHCGLLLASGNTPTLVAGDYTAEQLQIDGATMGGGIAYKIAGAAGSQTGASFSFTDSARGHGRYTSAYKPAASGPSGGVLHHHYSKNLRVR